MQRTGLKTILLGIGAVAALGLWAQALRGPGRAATTPAPYADQLPDYDGASLVASGKMLPGTLVVDFDDDMAEADIRAMGDRLGVEFRPSSRYSETDRMYLGRLSEGLNRLAVLAKLRKSPEVESAETALIYSIPEAAMSPDDQALQGLSSGPDAAKRRGFPNDPRFTEQWHMSQIRMEEAWEMSTGEGVIVAVIDTGVTKVSDLGDTELVPGWNFVDNNDQTEDDHGHGTHVAGTIAQSTHNGLGVAGVAYNARIMPMKVLGKNGSGSVAGIAQAIRWAADNGAKVINMSLGGPMPSQALSRAVKYAHDKGVTVVCAAGNDGRGRVSYPAASGGAIAVAATGGDERTTFYSNWGRQVAIAAPGGNTRAGQAGGVLQNTVFMGKEDYYFFMGTSMASPHVAGVAALLIAQGVTEPDAVRSVLEQSARVPKGLERKPADFSDRYGAGLLDAAASLELAQLGHGGFALGTGGALILLLLGMARRAGRLAVFGWGGVAGTILGASGLFILPWLGLGGLPGVSLLARGIPAWDIALLGPAAHGNLLFYSALIPVAFVALFYGFRRARGLLAGLAIGFAAHFAAQIFVPTVDVRFMPADALWLGLNAAICAGLGLLIARK